MKETVWHAMVLWDKSMIYITPQQRKVLEPAWEQGDTILKVGDNESLQASAVARFTATREVLPDKMLPESMRPKQLAEPEISDEQRARNVAKLREMRENVTRYGKAEPTDEEKAKVHEREKLSKQMNDELKAATTPKQREGIIKKYRAKIGTRAGGAGTGAVTGVRASEKQAITPKPEVPGAE